MQKFIGNIDCATLHTELLSAIGEPKDNSWYIVGSHDSVEVYSDATYDEAKIKAIVEVHIKDADIRALNKVKDTKKEEIRQRFNSESNLPVKAEGKTWNGGYDSAIKLDAARRLAESAGLKEVTFYDIENKACTLSHTSAQKVVSTLAGDYQLKFAKKQTLFATISQADSENKVNHISWDI